VRKNGQVIACKAAIWPDTGQYGVFFNAHPRIYKYVINAAVDVDGAEAVPGARRAVMGCGGDGKRIVQAGAGECGNGRGAWQRVQIAGHDDGVTACIRPGPRRYETRALEAGLLAAMVKVGVQVHETRRCWVAARSAITAELGFDPQDFESRPRGDALERRIPSTGIGGFGRLAEPERPAFHHADPVAPVQDGTVFVAALLAAAAFTYPGVFGQRMRQIIELSA